MLRMLIYPVAGLVALIALVAVMLTRLLAVALMFFGILSLILAVVASHAGDADFSVPLACISISVLLSSMTGFMSASVKPL